ncbi:MAG: hypothetical protein HFG01_06450 [Oscillibacter sp.]|nr:hypothetical protein [Oscillibacter sp.]
MIPTAGELLSYSNSVLKTVHRPLPLDRNLAYRFYKAADFITIYPGFRWDSSFWSFKDDLELHAFPSSQWITEPVAMKIFTAMVLTAIKLDASNNFSIAGSCGLKDYCMDCNSPRLRTFRLLQKSYVLKLGVI